MKGEKGERQSALRKLIREGHFENQLELASALTAVGHPATQASVSRDMRELGVLKVGGRYVLEPPAAPRAAARPPGLMVVRGAFPVGANLVVLKTPPGGAPIAASYLDHARRPELVGSVAGDDTIFIAVKSRADQGRLLAWLSGFRKGRQA